MSADEINAMMEDLADEVTKLQDTLTCQDQEPLEGLFEKIFYARCVVENAVR